MYNPLVISNYFIEKSISDIDYANDLTIMKLLKMVYISHGWFLAYNDRPLISDAVLAWRYGPVIVKIYNAFKHYGKSPVSSLVDISGNNYISSSELPNENMQKFLEPIWENYKKYSGLELSSLTHQSGSPWDITYHKHGKNSIIPNDLIKSHYKKKIGLTHSA